MELKYQGIHRIFKENSRISYEVAATFVNVDILQISK